jgi:hypothetical protein
LTDGSRLTAQNVRLEPADSLKFDTPFGARLAVPLSIVSSIQMLGGRAVYLSDLEPVEYSFTPYLSLDWDLRRDRSADGGPLAIGGIEFAKGLGLHSQCSVTYRLDGRYRLFHTLVGIDDAAATGGDAMVAVELDGRQIFKQDSLRRSSSPLALEALDIRGGQRLKLIVEHGRMGDVGDRVDWCDAVVVE